MICIQKMTLHSIHNCTYVLNNEKSLQICQLYCVCLLQGGVHIKIKVLNLQLAATGLPSNYIAILQLKNCSLGEGSNLYNSLKQNILSYIAFQIPKAHHLKHLCYGITTKHIQKNIPLKLCISQQNEKGYDWLNYTMEDWLPHCAWTEMHAEPKAFVR